MKHWFVVRTALRHLHSSIQIALFPAAACTRNCATTGRSRAFCKTHYARSFNMLPKRDRLYMTTSVTFPASLKNKLIVSCQSFPGDPLDHVETLRRIAISVLRGGAGGLRANGADSISVFRSETSLPIIGILKRFENDGPNITPDFASAQSVSHAGADIIGMDCSAQRPSSSEP